MTVEQLNVYPNPATGIVRIANGKPMEEIKGFTSTNVSTEIDGGLPNGVYILQAGKKISD